MTSERMTVLPLTGEPMPERYEVLCVKKSDRYNPHERITHLGGPERGWIGLEAGTAADG